MKNLILLVGCLFVFTACSTDNTYNITKAAYKSGKEIVKQTGMTNEELRSIDKVATSYDKARTTFRSSLEKKPDATTLEVVDSW